MSDEGQAFPTERWNPIPMSVVRLLLGQQMAAETHQQIFQGADMTNTTSKPEDLLLWLDLETTGTDETKDSILEIGCVLTTLQLDSISEFQSLCWPSDEAWGRLHRNHTVSLMHIKNGLINAIRGTETDSIPRPGQVDKAVNSWLRREIDKYIGVDPLTVDMPKLDRPNVVLAGSGVAHFDRRFLKQYLPMLDRRLRFYSLDVGVIRRATRMWAPEIPLEDHTGQKPHRALADALIHLAEAREFKRIWQDGIPVFDIKSVEMDALLTEVRRRVVPSPPTSQPF